MDICVLFTVVNSAVMNLHVYVFALQFGGGGSLSRSGIAWSCGNYILRFLWNHQTIFRMSSASLMEVLTSLLKAQKYLFHIKMSKMLSYHMIQHFCS